MTRDDRLRQAAEREVQSARLRERFGLTHNDAAGRVTDGLTGAGAIPFTVMVLALIAYAVVTLVFGA